MTNKEMFEQRYAILFEALLLGVPIKFDIEWDMIMHKGRLYEVCARRSYGKEITRRSTMTINDLLLVFDNISYDDLKTVFGNIRLHKLQNKLMKENV